MSKTVTIAIDAMGGDHGPYVVVPAALGLLKAHQNVALVLVGDQETLYAELHRRGVDVGERLAVQHASQKVEMHEPPSQALRTKKDSSMRVAIDLVKQGRAQASISAGNTGALMAIARYVLKTLPGIDRPAIMTAMPSMIGHTHVLDLGANVDCTAEHLLQFALMSSVLVSAVDDNEAPTVGLLNIGQEEIKGNNQVKRAARLLANSSLNYVGYVEGDDIFKGSADIVICDGFVGNVALKTTEGVAKLISHFLREEYRRNLFTRLIALASRPVLQAYREKIDPRYYNGASLVGLRGIVVKSHGGADEIAFTNSIRVAIREVEKDIPQRISNRLQSLLVERPAVV
jgi:glycerol-3-phosphate acyltransferase PlsX